MSRLKLWLGAYLLIGLLLSGTQAAVAWRSDCGMRMSATAARAVARTLLWLPDATYQVALNERPFRRWLLSGRCG